LVVLAKPGDHVREGDPLVEIHHRDGAGFEAAVALCRGAIAIDEAAPPRRENVLAEIQ
jgi:thymidine phosphorylase